MANAENAPSFIRSLATLLTGTVLAQAVPFLAAPLVARLTTGMTSEGGTIQSHASATVSPSSSDERPKISPLSGPLVRTVNWSTRTENVLCSVTIVVTSRSMVAVISIDI